jgi:hypothetical protein
MWYHKNSDSLVTCSLFVLTTACCQEIVSLPVVGVDIRILVIRTGLCCVELLWPRTDHSTRGAWACVLNGDKRAGDLACVYSRTGA